MSLSQDTPHVTHHSDLRWVSRTKDFDIDSVLTAWADAKPVTLESRDCTAARWHEGHNVLLLAQNDAITTVLHADHEEFTPSQSKRRCTRCGYTARVPPDAACDWCYATDSWDRLDDIS